MKSRKLAWQDGDHLSLAGVGLKFYSDAKKAQGNTAVEKTLAEASDFVRLWKWEFRFTTPVVAFVA